MIRVKVRREREVRTNPWLTPSTKLLSPHSWNYFGFWIHFRRPFDFKMLQIAAPGDGIGYKRHNLLSALQGSLSAQVTGIEWLPQMEYFLVINQSNLFICARLKKVCARNTFSWESDKNWFQTVNIFATFNLSAFTCLSDQTWNSNCWYSEKVIITSSQASKLR